MKVSKQRHGKGELWLQREGENTQSSRENMVRLWPVSERKG